MSNQCAFYYIKRWGRLVMAITGTLEHAESFVSSSRYITITSTTVSFFHRFATKAAMLKHWIHTGFIPLKRGKLYCVISRVKYNLLLKCSNAVLPQHYYHSDDSLEMWSVQCAILLSVVGNDDNTGSQSLWKLLRSRIRDIEVCLVVDFSISSIVFVK